MQALQVFCGSNAGHDPVFTQAAREVADMLVRQDIRLVYGGGNVGLMGILADRVLEKGGEVTGVIPVFLQEREVCHAGLTELILVDSMHERKIQMAERSDGVIVLPGGFGTLDELFEMLTLVQLSQVQQPIGMLNVSGFYDLLFRQLDHMLAMGFLRPQHRQLLLQASDVASLFRALENFVPEKKVGKWGFQL
mgnify:CR=1 FL=1